jgi:GNAT superfamily N-acetyltransferase
MAESDHDVLAIHGLLMQFGAESAEASIDPVKTMKVAYETVMQHAAIVAEVDGEIVGSLGIVRHQHWYSNDHFLIDQWLYVKPEHRGGEVLPAMLEEAKAIADLAGLRLLVAVTNHKRERGIPGQLGKIASLLRYVPGGSVFEYTPM